MIPAELWWLIFAAHTAFKLGYVYWALRQ